MVTYLGTIKKLRGMCKELKNSGRIKYLWETSGNIKIHRDSRTAVIKVLHERDLEIEFPDFNFSYFFLLIHSASNFFVALVPLFCNLSFSN